MSTDWWSAGQRWLEQQALKESAAQKRAWVKAGRSAKTFRYNPPEWHRDAVAALGRNDEETFKAIKLGQLGTKGLPPLRRHHATAKKTSAQLDREIAEALSSGEKPTTWMQRKALYDRGAYSGCDTFLLTYLPYHEMAPYKSSSAFGYGSYEECFDTRELAERRLAQLRRENRIEWAKIYQHDARYPLQRKLVDEWDDSQVTMQHATRRSSRRKGPPVVGSHGLGTADVRTQEGAYWIVTRPNGYRVDYKAWGPSNEEDLGTFSSRRQAQAKIVAHAGGPGAILHAKRR